VAGSLNAVTSNGIEGFRVPAALPAPTTGLENVRIRSLAKTLVCSKLSLVDGHRAAKQFLVGGINQLQCRGAEDAQPPAAGTVRNRNKLLATPAQDQFPPE